MRKRILSILLCIVMMLSLLPTVAFADSPINGVAVTDVQTPVLNASCSTSGITVTTAPNADAFKNSFTRWAKKVTDDEVWHFRLYDEPYKNMTESDTFEEGTYRLFLDVGIKDEYSFSAGCETTINGETATSILADSDQFIKIWSEEYSVTAPTPATEITSVSITGLKVPEVGTTLSEFLSTVKVPADADYSIMDYACFIKGSDTRMAASQKFEAGVEYYFGAVIYPDTGYMFSASTAVSTADIAKGSQTVEANAEMGGMTVLTIETVSFTPTASTPVTEYDVWVGDVQVDETNKDDVLGDGKVSYNPETATLTLNNATITTEKNGIWADDDLNIVLNGNLTITSAWNGIYGNKNLSISGNGDINITNTSSYGINSDFGALSISGSGNIVINSGGGGIYGYKGVSIIRSGNMTVEAKGTGKAGIYCGDVATLAVSGKTTINSPSYGILAITKLEMNAGILDATSTDKFAVLSNAIVIKDGLEITTPASTYIKDGTVFDSVSKTEAKHLVIGPKVVSYDVWVNGEQFTSDKLTIKCGDGTATYDPEKAELTIENVTITIAVYAAVEDAGIYSASDIDIIAKGTNTIKSAGIGISVFGNLTISGNGNVQIESKDRGIYGKDITVSGDVDVQIATESTAISSKNTMLCGKGDLRIDNKYSGIYAEENVTICDERNVYIISSESDGMSVNGTVTVSGSGEMSVDAKYIGIGASKDVVISDNRNLTIKAGMNGISSFDGNVTLSSTGDVTIEAGNHGAKAENGSVTISGSGNVKIKSEQYGVSSKNDLILSGSGEVDIYGKEHGVNLLGTDSKVLLNGTGSPIKLSGSGKDNCAVGYKGSDGKPVAGTNFSDYEAQAGDPVTMFVVYTLKAPVSYTIIAGANGEWTKGSTTGHSVTSDAPFAKFDSVKVDGAEIAAANYTAEEGSTKITLAPAYLETLSEGVHSVEVVSSDGSASTNFTVKVAPVTTGTITISKTFMDIDEDDCPINTATFTVTSNDGTYNKTAKVGDRDFAPNPAAGQFVWKLNDVPAGTYTVTETAYEVDGYSCTVTYKVGTGDEQEGDSATAALAAGEDLVFTFVDTYVEDVTVTFDMNGHGTQVPAQTISSGEKATKPADPTATGYIFEGWYADATFSAAFDFNIAITADTTVYAKWTEERVTPPAPATYTVTFNMNGHGTQVPTQTVEEGNKATKPADPSASGYTFDGWYADATFSAKFDFSSAINANTTVYAKWTEVKKDEPTKPADPTNPTQPTKPADPTSPKTGDNSHLFLWVALLFISGGALAGTAVYGKKRKYNAK